MHQIQTEDLKKVIALSELPDEHLQWILDHSEYIEYPDGTQIKKTGDDADVMIMTIDGSISFYLELNGRLIFYFSFCNDELSGGVGGLLPHSRMKTYPGCSFAVGKVRTLQLHKDHFHELERLNPDFIQRLIGYMTERAKIFATTQMQQEKVNALGQLSAGIAHELNNPVSAISRMSFELSKRLKLNYELTEKLLEYKLSSQLIQGIRVMVELKEGENAVKQRLSPLQRMEKEDEINDWLEQKGLPRNDNAGETFAESGFSSKDLDIITCEFEKDSFSQLLNWLENLLISQRVIKDLEEASSRISNLVGAIKSHVHMDRTNDLQPTNIHNDIENTLTLLGHKLREKNITVKKIFSEDLADVPAYVGELNQVWTNIIDNAIYALDKNGEITIETSIENKRVLVKIIDNGSGIPQDILSRIFDPFFTTKKVGDGTGIGLDIVSRIIKHHKGEVTVNSKPGRTEFNIRIPAAENIKS